MATPSQPSTKQSLRSYELRGAQKTGENACPRKLEIAFATAVLGLLLVPFVLNLYSLLLLTTLRPRRLSKDNRKRYVFTWFLNMGALTMHAIFLNSWRT